MIADNRESVGSKKIDVPPLDENRLVEGMGLKDWKELREKVKGKTAMQLTSLADNVLERNPDWKAAYKSQDIVRHFETASSRRTFLESAGDKVKGVLTNKWVLLGGAAILGYLAYRNWSDIMSKVNELAGKGYAQAKEVGMAAPSVTSGPVVDSLKDVDSFGGTPNITNAAEKANKFYD